MIVMILYIHIIIKIKIKMEEVYIIDKHTSKELTELTELTRLKNRRLIILESELEKANEALQVKI